MGKKPLGIIIAICIIIAAVWGILGAVYPTEQGEFTMHSRAVHFEAEGKVRFAEEMDARYAEEAAAGKIKESTWIMDDRARDYTWKETDLWMMECVLAEEEEREQLLEKLETYGIYEFTLKTSGKDINDASVTLEGVELSTPTFFYYAGEQVWIVAVGGRWMDDSWDQNILSGEVGQRDTMGVRFRDTNEKYRTYMMNCMVCIMDSRQKEKVFGYNRCNADSGQGVLFELQDYTYRTSLAEKEYVGACWYAAAVYDKRFAEYEGIAETYYHHTWSYAE